MAHAPEKGPTRFARKRQSYPWDSSWKRVGMAAVLLATFATGCTQLDQMRTGLGIGGGPLPVYAGDPCGLDRTAFSGSQNYFAKRVLTSAVTGAVVGAAAGALFGALTGNAGSGALIGLGTGTATGLTAGLLSTANDRYQDQQTAALQINSDLTREGQEIDHVTATFARLRQCRFAQAQGIKQNAYAGGIDRTAALAMLTRQKGLFGQEIDLAQQYGVSMQKRDEEFRQAIASLQPQQQQQVAAAENPASFVAPESSSLRSVRPGLTQRAPQAVVAMTETIPEKRNSFVNSVNAAREEAVVAFNIDAA